MTPWLDDGDVRLYHGDALQVLAGLPDASVDCVVTSPPYWGLRDYGTGQWDGGDPECDHKPPPRQARKFTNGRGEGQGDDYAGTNLTSWTYRDATVKEGGCPKGCGARRVDHQLGLEPTPDLFVHNMVEVFRQVRRVLAAHGTVWCNLGDSYSSVVAGLKPKDLTGIPWRVAFALQQDGWYLRSDIIWAKPNPMPESVTDRPTKAHEYVFLLTKRPRYWFDAEAVREPHTGPPPEHYGVRNQPKDRGITDALVRNGEVGVGKAREYNPAGRNVRSVWQIATQPYPEAHFATFPEELARRCILAGCPTRVCRVCGKPSERIVERESVSRPDLPRDHPEWRPARYDNGKAGGPQAPGPGQRFSNVETLGWSDCGHNQWRPGTVLDPFIGSGTVAKVARDHQRHAIGIDLSEEYLQLAARRLQQLSLLA